jgi:hypothetical protein
MFIYVALASLPGCASVNTMLNSFNSDSNGEYVGQPNIPDDAPSSDDTPYAIQQYLDQIKVARNNQSDEQTTLGKSESQKNN